MRQGETIARLWNCGDEVCDCWEPMIEEWTGTGFKPIWSGTFQSQPSLDEIRLMEDELRAAIEKYKPTTVKVVWQTESEPNKAQGDET